MVSESIYAESGAEKGKAAQNLTLDLQPQGQGRRTSLLEAGSDDCAEFPDKEVCRCHRKRRQVPPRTLKALPVTHLGSVRQSKQFPNAELMQRPGEYSRIIYPGALVEMGQ